MKAAYDLAAFMREGTGIFGERALLRRKR